MVDMVADTFDDIEIPEEFREPEGDAELDDPDIQREASTSSLRTMWGAWMCRKGPGTFSEPKFFGKTIGPVPAPAVDAFRALESALKATGYTPKSAWAYNCRKISGTNVLSLHSGGIAIDLDPKLNPFTKGDPYSGALKKNHVAAVLGIKNPQGKSVWSWGGNWSRSKDRMHFQLDQGPKDVAVDWSTVPGGEGMTSTTTTMGGDEFMITRGAGGEAVTTFQNCLMHWNAEALPKHKADGDYGGETEDWVKKFQQAMGIPASGSIDGVTAALLTMQNGS